jgi:hypothetical protein
MTEITIVFISKSEVLLGAMIDTGEVEVEKDRWVKFSRLRLGLFFLTLNFTWFSHSA